MTFRSTITNRRWRRLVVAIAPTLAVAAAAVVTSTVSPVAASASTSALPFTDEYANGSITLCGIDNKPVTSGSLLTIPFVWKYVSSVPAPKNFTRAYAVLYQPLAHVDAGDWSGYQLNTAAIFSNPAHPVAQSTYRDPPLEWPDHSFPPYVDGLYELRLYLTGVYAGLQSTSYPTAVIKVSGSKWSLVQGGTTPCNAGTAVSLETTKLPASETNTPQSLVVNPNPYEPGATTTIPPPKAAETSKASSTTTTSTQSLPGSNVTSPSPSAEALGGVGPSHSSSGGFPLAAVLGAGGVVAVVALGGAGWRRRRRGLAPAHSVEPDDSP